MKKTIALAALIVAASFANAQVAGVASYDYAKVAGKTTSVQEVAAGIKTSIAGFGVEALGVNALTTNPATNSVGYEFAASKGFASVLGLTPTVRLGVGHQNTANSVNYMVASADLRAPFILGTTGVVGYRFRNGFNDSYGMRSNRVSLGLEKDLTKNLSAGVSYAHTTGPGYLTNGVVTSVSYKF